jgi:hypothetical protein
MPDRLTPAGPTILREEATDLLGADPGDGDIGGAEAPGMATSPTLSLATVAETGETFDPIACLDDRVRRASRLIGPADPGFFIQIQGVGQTLLIPLPGEVTHIGRGLAADLRLNERSVSRRHAIIVQRPSGHRILDDRSFNGTFVNGRRVEHCDLRDGDVITLGRVVLRYVSDASRHEPGDADPIDS